MDINMKELKQVVYDDNDCNGFNFGDCVWRKPYTVTFPTTPTGVGVISVKRDATESTCEQTTAVLVLNGGTVLYGDTITITATPATGYNGPSIKSIQGVDIIDPDTAPHTGKVTGDVSFQVDPGLIKNFSVSYIAKPTGVALFRIYAQEPGLSSSVYVDNPTEPGSFSVPYGTKVYAVATAATGYNNPTVTGISTSSSSPTTVTGNIAAYITAGSLKTYTLTISSITGVASQTITRTSSPLKGAATGALSNDATIYYGDKLTMTATEATGYSAPSVPSGEVTVTGNIKTSDYISAGTLASYTVTLAITSGPGTFNKTTLGSSGIDRPEINGRTITIPSTGDSTYLNYNTYALQFSSARSTSGTWAVGSWNSSSAVTAYSNNYVIDDFTGGSDGGGNIYGDSVLYITTSGSANSFTSTLTSAPTNSSTSGAQTWVIKDSLGYLGTNGRIFTAPTNTSAFYYTISPSPSTTGTFTPTSGTTFTATVTRYAHSFTLTKSTIAGVASHTITRTSSPYGGASTGTLANGATIYYGDVLTITATADSGYSAPTVTSPITVSGNVATSTYVKAGLSAPVINSVECWDFNLAKFNITNNNSVAVDVKAYLECDGCGADSCMSGYYATQTIAANTTSTLTYNFVDEKDTSMCEANLNYQVSFEKDGYTSSSVVSGSVEYDYIRCSITWDLANCTVTNMPTYIECGDSIGLDVIPNTGYVLPESITVVGHVESSWEPEVESEQLCLWSPTGPITITIAAIADGEELSITFPRIKGNTSVLQSGSTGNYIHSASSEVTTYSGYDAYSICVIDGITVGTAWTEIRTMDIVGGSETRYAMFVNGILSVKSTFGVVNQTSTSQSVLVPIYSTTAVFSGKIEELIPPEITTCEQAAADLVDLEISNENDVDVTCYITAFDENDGAYGSAEIEIGAGIYDYPITITLSSSLTGGYVEAYFEADGVESEIVTASF